MNEDKNKRVLEKNITGFYLEIKQWHWTYFKIYQCKLISAFS